MSSSPRRNRPPKQKQGKSTVRRTNLAASAQETLSVLPGLLQKRPELRADESIVYNYHAALPSISPNAYHQFRQRAVVQPTSADPLDAEMCPGLAQKARVAVVNADSFNAALEIRERKQRPQEARVLVMNFASHKRPGGGWLGGAVAQEEALCYRSSLALGLHKEFYPQPTSQGIYTRDVLVIRSAMDEGHRLLAGAVADAADISDLPVVSVITIAAVNHPQLAQGGPSGGRSDARFADAAERETSKEKMRMALRIAGGNGHRSLVLGAMGCGVFANPPTDVARCWAEVLGEPEFAGGWREDICFAVYDRRNEGNYGKFRDILDGLEF